MSEFSEYSEEILRSMIMQYEFKINTTKDEEQAESFRNIVKDLQDELDRRK